MLYVKLRVPVSDGKLVYSNLWIATLMLPYHWKTMFSDYKTKEKKM